MSSVASNLAATRVNSLLAFVCCHATWAVASALVAAPGPFKQLVPDQLATRLKDLDICLHSHQTVTDAVQGCDCYRLCRWPVNVLR